MKRLISILAAIILLAAIPGVAAAAPPDWTLVQIPAPENGASPVCVDIGGYFTDITVDADNNLYVMSESKITRFTPDGQADRSWGKNGYIYDRSIEETYCEQMSIAADSRGYVYALCRICEDGSPTFIKRYTPGGEADKSWYGDGIMGGKFAGEDFVGDEAESPGGIRNGDEIAIDSEDNLYVLYDRQVYKFMPDGTPDENWRTVELQQPRAVYDDGGDGVWFSNAMSADRGDNVYLFNGYDQIVSEYSSTGRSLKRQRCPLYYLNGGDESTQYLINQVVFDSEGNIYNINPDGTSISKYSPEYLLDTAWCGSGTFTAGKDSEPVQTVTDFEMDAAGSIYILDEGNKVISRYTNDGSLDKGWGTNGSIGSVNGDGKAMLSVTDIISGTDGSMYVNTGYLSGGNAIIAKINPGFSLDDTWGADVSGSFKGYMTDAYNTMAVHNGNLYVERSEGSGGAVTRLYGGKEDTEWEIVPNGPVWDLQTDDSGNIYAAGEMITKYLPNGSVDESWGISGTIDGVGFIGEMAVDRKGYLYISDRGDDCIVRYTPEGLLDTHWGENGKADIPGATEDSKAYYSYFIAVDSAGNLYLSDYLNNRIIRYDSEGRIDTTWCGGGEWRSEGSFSGALAPMIHPTHLMIRNGRLYAIWNGRLYVMSDSIAQVGVKPPQAPLSEPAEEAAATAEPLAAWRWAVSIGGLLFCAGAVTAMILLLPEKKNKRRRMAKIKSIKIKSIKIAKR
jgi:uncharacterized delta-60 repeat protein